MLSGRKIGRGCVGIMLVGAVTIVNVGCDDPWETVVSVSAQPEAINIASALLQVGQITDARIRKGGSVREVEWDVRVPVAEKRQAWDTLVRLRLPSERRTGAKAALESGGLIPTEVEEHARLNHAKEQQLASMLEMHDGVVEARVHLNSPKGDAISQSSGSGPVAVSVVIKTLVQIPHVWHHDNNDNGEADDSADAAQNADDKTSDSELTTTTNVDVTSPIGDGDGSKTQGSNDEAAVRDLIKMQLVPGPESVRRLLRSVLADADQETARASMASKVEVQYTPAIGWAALETRGPSGGRTGPRKQRAGFPPAASPDAVSSPTGWSYWLPYFGIVAIGLAWALHSLLSSGRHQNDSSTPQSQG